VCVRTIHEISRGGNDQRNSWIRNNRLRSTPGLHFDRRGDEARREAMGKKGASSEAKKLAKLRAQEAAALIQATLDAAYTAGDPFVDAVKPFAAFERNGITGARCELMCGDTAHDQSIAT
jgi:hypothetical protein